MKVVMYHYVRPSTNLAHFAYLRLKDFRHQLDWFESKWGFVRRQSFSAWLAGGQAPKGILLTFDDGLRDHVEFVLPVLLERGLFALFYVPTGPFETGVVLDVHKVHLAVGRLGGLASAEWLKAHAPEAWAIASSEEGVILPYEAQRSDNATKQVKALFNWMLGPDERRTLLDGLLDHAFGGSPPKVDEVYCTAADVRRLAHCGMGVGPHGHNHIVLSQLQRGAQAIEVSRSCDAVEAMGGSRQWGFCYPYGLPNAFNGHSEKVVEDAGCPFAFAVEGRDIEVFLREAPRFALPRHNCNTFVHGTATFGATEKCELAG